MTRSEGAFMRSFRISPVIIICLLFMGGLAFAAINPELQVYNYTLSENPATPGHTVTLTLHIREIEFGNCADTISVQVMTAYPLSVSGMDTKYLDSLCLGDPDSMGTVSFDFPVDSFAQSGTYPIEVVTNYQQHFDKFSATNTVNVHVSGTPSFVASVVSSNPVDIYPGDTASFTVSLQNIGTGKADSVTAAMAAQDGIEVKWAGSQQELGQIEGKGSTLATFDIEAQKDAKSGPYGLTMALNYTSEDGTPHTQVFDFTLPLKEKADFIASAPNGTTLQAGSDTDVPITITNTGSQEADKVKVQIQPIYPFSTDGTVRYVESLKPGESKNLVYTIHTDSDATAGSQISSVLINFQDPQGTSFSDSEDFSLNVKILTLTEQIMSYWYVFAAIVVFIALSILWRLFKFVTKGLGKKESGVEEGGG